MPILYFPHETAASVDFSRKPSDFSPFPSQFSSVFFLLSSIFSFLSCFSCCFYVAFLHQHFICCVFASCSSPVFRHLPLVFPLFSIFFLFKLLFFSFSFFRRSCVFSVFSQENQLFFILSHIQVGLPFALYMGNKLPNTSLHISR